MNKFRKIQATEQATNQARIIHKWTEHFTWNRNPVQAYSQDVSNKVFQTDLREGQWNSSAVEISILHHKHATITSAAIYQILISTHSQVRHKTWRILPKASTQLPNCHLLLTCPVYKHFQEKQCFFINHTYPFSWSGISSGNAHSHLLTSRTLLLLSFTSSTMYFAWPKQMHVCQCCQKICQCEFMEKCLQQDIMPSFFSWYEEVTLLNFKQRLRIPLAINPGQTMKISTRR